MSRVFLNFASLSNLSKPLIEIDMLSMSKQPQDATKTCPFRGVKRKKRRRSWKIATPWQVICHGSMPWLWFRFLPLEKCFHEFCEANKASNWHVFIIWMLVNETNQNNTHEQTRTCKHEKHHQSRMGLGWTIDRKKLFAPKKRWTPSPSADVTVSTKTCWRFQGRQFPKTAWPASLQTTHASGFGCLYLFSFVGTVSQGITAGHCAGSGKKICNLDFEKGVSWFIVRFLSSFGIPDLSWKACPTCPETPVLET